jgi:hypothetical protein
MQYELFDLSPSLSATEFETFLNEGGSRAVELKVTRNRVSMVTVEFFPDGSTKVRMHEGFLNAPAEILTTLRRYIRSRSREAWMTVSEYAKSIQSNTTPTGSSALRAAGKVYDLKIIFDSVNNECFGGKVSCTIGWGRGRPRGKKGRRSKSIRYGSWDPTTSAIRIHPLLDDIRVPSEFVRYIIFHEMLHTIVPEERVNGRRYDHPPQFRALERAFPNIKEIHRLAKELLDVLV